MLVDVYIIINIIIFQATSPFTEGVRTKPQP